MTKFDYLSQGRNLSTNACSRRKAVEKGPGIFFSLSELIEKVILLLTFQDKEALHERNGDSYFQLTVLPRLERSLQDQRFVVSEKAQEYFMEEFRRVFRNCTVGEV